MEGEDKNPLEEEIINFLLKEYDSDFAPLLLAQPCNNTYDFNIK